MADVFVIVAQRIPQWQSGRENLNVGETPLHVNAPVHKPRVAQAAICECKFKLLNHPPYSPDLALSDYYLFRK